MMNKHVELELFFHRDEFDLMNYPDEGIRRKIIIKNSKYNLTNLKEPLKTQMKYFIQHILRLDVQPQTIKENYFIPLHILIDFFTNYEDVDSLDEYEADMRQSYIHYLNEKNIAIKNSCNVSTVTVLILSKFADYYNTFISKEDVFCRDIWDMSQIGLDDRRVVKSNRVIAIDFTTIGNKANREIIKNYVKHLIVDTDKSMNTIKGNFTSVKRLAGFLKEIEFKDINRNNVLDYYDYLGDYNFANSSFNEIVFSLIRFMKFLIVSDELEVNHFYNSDAKSDVKTHTFKSVDNYTLNQIFSVLDKMPTKEAAMFLLLYTTGLRISEVCELELDSIIKNEKGYFVRSYSTKMSKDAFNPIPESLYDLLVKQRKNAIIEYGKSVKFMFSYTPDNCYNSSTYRNRVRKRLIELGVKNTDGSPYIFNPHDYRHTLATEMLKNDIPISVIQKILHHESIEMTVSYIDIDDQRKIKKHTEFINIKGEKMPLGFEVDMNVDDLAKVEWLKKTINAQMLPNGMCSLPVVMGKCPHANSCLTCEEFKTSHEFLPVHQNHYKRVCGMIEYSKKQGWQRQVETNEEVKQNLEKIIISLNNEKEESA